jgi:GDP-mannose 6-dehydrogenase
MLGLSFKPGTDDLRESPIAELIEILIGKGHQVAIYDREVSIARLRGANKAYIEQTIPHISSLMKPSVGAAVDGSEVVVVAKRSAEFDDTLKTLNNGHCVVDLVSAMSDEDEQKGGYEGICW